METVQYPIGSTSTTPIAPNIQTKHTPASTTTTTTTTSTTQQIPNTPTTTNYILDIRTDKTDLELLERVQNSIHEAACHDDGDGETDAEISIPDLLLWDEKGLQYFEDVTYSPTYYLTNEEIGILEKEKGDIAWFVRDGGVLVELGSGNLRKTKILLEELDKQGREIDYFALDVSFVELQRTLNTIPPGTFRHIRCFGLYGTYDDAREWLRRPGIASRTKTLLFLGSTLGGFARDEAAGFLSSFVPTEPREGESLPGFLVGLDGCKEPQRVYEAYNDGDGVNRRFVRHGLERANEILGFVAFELGKWDVIGKWDEANGCHKQFYFPKEDVRLAGMNVPAGRRILAIQSHKYDAADRESLCRAAGLRLVDLWSSTEQYRICYLSPLGDQETGVAGVE